jgi:hypothetical protein
LSQWRAQLTRQSSSGASEAQLNERCSARTGCPAYAAALLEQTDKEKIMQSITFEVVEVKKVQTDDGAYTEVKLSAGDASRSYDAYCATTKDPMSWANYLETLPKVGNWRGDVFCSRNEPFILRIQDKSRLDDFKLGDKLTLAATP